MFASLSDEERASNRFGQSAVSCMWSRTMYHLSVFRARGVLNQPVNLNCVPLVLDGDAKRHKVYTGSGNRCPMSSLRERSCIPCTEVLVVGVTSRAREGVSPRSLRGMVWAA